MAPWNVAQYIDNKCRTNIDRRWEKKIVFQNDNPVASSFL